VPSVVGDLPEAIGPVVTPPRENLHYFVSEMHLDTIAVELDFMDPRSPDGTRSIEAARAGSMKPGKGALTPSASGFFPLEGHRYTRRRLNCCRSCGE